MLGGVIVGAGLDVTGTGVLSIGEIPVDSLPYASQVHGGMLQQMHDPVSDFNDPVDAADLNTILNILRDTGVLAPST